MSEMNGHARRARTEEIVLQKCTATAMEWIAEGAVDAGQGLLDAAALVAEVIADSFGREIETDRDAHGAALWEAAESELLTDDAVRS